jgi:hypothetical protein
VVRFDAAEDAARAEPVLAALGGVSRDGEGPAALVVEGAAGRGAEAIRALGAASLFPSEVVVRRQTLEHVFIELTANPGQTGAGPAAGPASGSDATPDAASEVAGWAG